MLRPPTSIRRLLSASVLAPLLLLGACDLGPSGPDLPDSGQVPMDDLLVGDMEVVPDPAGVAPLTALATLRTVVPTRVSVEVLGDVPLRHDFAAEDRVHSIPLLGLYPDAENRVAIRLEQPGGVFAVDTLRISTDPLPELLPDVVITAADPARMEPGWTLSSLHAGDGESTSVAHPIAFDRRGDIRWYLDLSSLGGLVYAVEQLENGNLIYGHGSVVYEVDMLGREVGRWEIPGFHFHHDVVEKPDGNLLIAVDVEGRATVEDHVIELGRASGEVVREWDLRDVLDPLRRSTGLADDEDWFHMNSVWHDPSDGGLILSGRNQSAVVKVSRDNELVWILGAHRGWNGADSGGPDLSAFLLTAVDGAGQPYDAAVQEGAADAPDFRWNWAQHAAMILPNGNLFLFDNGLLRNFSTTQPASSRGVEYRVDPVARTVRQVWEYGGDRGAEYFSPIISDVDHLPSTGNRLVMPGVASVPDLHAYVTEVTHPEGEVVFEARIDFKNLQGSGVVEPGQFDLVYRSERLTPYP